MTPFARYVFLLESLQSQRIPDDPEAKRLMVRRMRREGVPMIELAKRFEVSRQTIRDWCTDRVRAYRHPAETRRRYVELRASGLSVRKACAELGLSRGTVAKWG